MAINLVLLRYLFKDLIKILSSFISELLEWNDSSTNLTISDNNRVLSTLGNLKVDK